MEYVQVVNWDRFQAYKDRNPPWVKLYQTILDDYSFLNLPDEAKLHVILIWLLASRLDNKIASDPAYIQSRIMTESAPDIALLMDAGFLEPWQYTVRTQSVPSRARESRGEESREEKSRVEKNIASIEALSAPADEKVPFDEIQAYWQSKEKLANYHPCRQMTPNRRKHLNARWKQLGFRERWREIIDRIEASHWLAVECKPFNFTWWIKNTDNWLKILEGNYDSRSGAKRAIAEKDWKKAQREQQRRDVEFAERLKRAKEAGKDYKRGALTGAFTKGVPKKPEGEERFDEAEQRKRLSKQLEQLKAEEEAKDEQTTGA